MKLDLTGLFNGTESRLTVKEYLNVDFAGDEVYVTGPVDLDFNFFKAGDVVIGKGTVKAKVKLLCSRCLKEIDETVSVDVFEQFNKEVTLKAESGEIELEEDDFVFPIDDDGARPAGWSWLESASALSLPSISATDPSFQADEAMELLRSAGAEGVRLVDGGDDAQG